MEKISKAKIKLFQSYKLKKFRDKDNLFIAQGTKVVCDCLPYFRLGAVVATEEWYSANGSILPKCQNIFQADAIQLSQISTLTTAADVYAVFERKEPVDINYKEENALFLALDGVQDPGNLGTIIRIADWFGIKHIFASEDTVDVYNPKVIQATMGSLSRVNIHYGPLENVIARVTKENIPIYGTFLDGEDIYKSELPHSAMVIMGNEGKGISPKIGQCVTNKLLIPPFPKEKECCDSLNVAVATAIICNEFRRF